MAKESDHMAEDDGNTYVAEPIKSPTDLEIEKLNARLDALENENRELRNANKGLWAELHPVNQPAVEPITVGDDMPVNTGPTDYEIVVNKLGLKEE